MKKLYIFFIFSLASFSFSSCHPTGEEIQPYEVSTDLRQDTIFHFEALTDRFHFTLEAEGDWVIETQQSESPAAKSIADWIKVNPISGGKGKYSIEVGITPNLSLVTRQAHLLLRHQEKTQKWEIRQEPCCYERDGVTTLAVHTPGSLQKMLADFISPSRSLDAIRVLGNLNRDDITTLNRLNMSYLDLRQAATESLSFAFHPTLKTLFLPETATEISDGAMSGMSGLEYIHGTNVLRIGNTAFSSCSKLKDYDLPHVTQIGADAFAGCKGLRRLVFPEATEIGASAFRLCDGIAEVSFDALETIEQQFSGWNGPSNIEKLNLPNLKHAGNQAFAYQKKLEKLHLPSLETCGMNLIYMSEIEEINCPAMKEIPESAFSGNEHLRRAVFEKAKKVGARSFMQCKKLKDVITPSAEQIEENAFYACNLGGELDFSSVQFIGSGSFERSDGLGSHVVRFPLAIYVGAMAFSYCTELVTIELPIVNMIGAQAFFGCTKLISLADENRLPAVSLGDYAFGECVSLRRLDFPLLTKLGAGCFSGCTLSTLKFKVLDWSYSSQANALWPDPPFEFWTFPVENTKMTSLYLGVSPFPIIIDRDHPWWRESGGTILFMNRVWASVHEYVQD